MQRPSPSRSSIGWTVPRRRRSRRRSRPRPGSGRPAGRANRAPRCSRRGARRAAAGAGHARRRSPRPCPVRRPYSASEDRPPGAPSCRSRGPPRGRAAVCPRSSAGRVEDPAGWPPRSRPGRSDRTSEAAVGLADDRGHPGQVARDDRHAGRHRLEQLVRRRQAMVQRRRLDRHRHDVRGGDPVEQLRRRHGRQDLDAAARRSGRRRPALRARPQRRRSRGARARRPGRAGSPRSAARSRGRARTRPGRGRRARRRRGPRRLVEPARAARVGTSNRYEQFMTISGRGTPNRRGHDLRVGTVDRDDAVRPARPAALHAGRRGARRPGQPGEVAGVEVDVPRVVDDPRALAPREVEGDRDAHVGHAVVRGRRRTRSRRALPLLRADRQGDRGDTDDGARPAPAPRATSERPRATGRGVAAARRGRRPGPAGSDGASAPCAPRLRGALDRPSRRQRGERQPIDRRDRHPDDPVSAWAPAPRPGARAAGARAPSPRGRARRARSRSGRSASRTRPSSAARAQPLRTAGERRRRLRSSVTWAPCGRRRRARAVRVAARGARATPISQFQRSWAAVRQRRRRSAASSAGRSRIARIAAPIASGSVGSQTAPSGPSGSSRTIRRISGKSLTTTGTPAGGTRTACSAWTGARSAWTAGSA